MTSRGCRHFGGWCMVFLHGSSFLPCGLVSGAGGADAISALFSLAQGHVRIALIWTFTSTEETTIKSMNVSVGRRRRRRTWGASGVRGGGGRGERRASATEEDVGSVGRRRRPDLARKSSHAKRPVEAPCGGAPVGKHVFRPFRLPCACPAVTSGAIFCNKWPVHVVRQLVSPSPTFEHWHGGGMCLPSPRRGHCCRRELA